MPPKKGGAPVWSPVCAPVLGTVLGTRIGHPLEHPCWHPCFSTICPVYPSYPVCPVDPVNPVNPGREYSVAVNVPLLHVFLRYVNILQAAECLRMPSNAPECACVLGLNVPLRAVVESSEIQPLHGL